MTPGRWRGAWARVETADGWEAVAKKKTPPSERRDWRAALVTEASGGNVRVKVADGGATGSIVSQDVAWARAGKGLKSGDLIFVEPAQGGGFRLRQVPIVICEMKSMSSRPIRRSRNSKSCATAASSPST